MATARPGRTWCLVVSAALLLGSSGTVLARPQSAGVTNAGQTVAVERDGDFVRVRTPGQQVDATDDGWRKRVGVTRDGSDDVLVELGAREEEGSIRLALGGDVLFDFDSAALRPEARGTLARVAQVIRDRGRGEVVVVGHTDSIGTEAYNQKLSEDRAAAVITYLSLDEGIPASMMVARGMGARQPVAYNTMPDGSDNPEGRAQNRRVEIFVATSPDVDVRKTSETTRVSVGGSNIVVQQRPGGQTIEVGGRTIAVDEGGGRQRIQVGDTVVDVPTTGAARSTGAAAASAATGSAGGSASAATGRNLRQAQPVQCSGLRSVQLDGVIIDAPGIAIEASGSCVVQIRNSEIRSGAVAIAATGMSTVTIVDSVVVGRLGAVGASGSAVVNAQGSEFQGAIVKSGLANFNDRGGNRLP